jgi:hypothetical protein
MPPPYGVPLKVEAVMASVPSFRMPPPNRHGKVGDVEHATGVVPAYPYYIRPWTLDG